MFFKFIVYTRLSQKVIGKIHNIFYMTTCLFKIRMVQLT